MSALSYTKETDKSGEGLMRVGFDACTRRPLSWKEEIYAAARDIAGRTTKRIWVCSSGGIDSELACRAFFDQSIPFSVLTLEHIGGTNDHDIKYARKWCIARGVEQKVVQIDMAHFLNAEVARYAERYQAVHPFRYFQIKLMELVEDMGGYAVLCSGEQLYQADLSKAVITRADMYLPLTNGNIVPLQWCDDNDLEHEPYFHYATPELCLSYMREPLVAFALDNPELVFRHPANVYTFKRLVYQSIWNDIEIRYKYDGYENIRKPLFEDALKRLHERFDANFVQYRIPVDECIEQLSSDISE